jgi:putative endonuclease
MLAGNPKRPGMYILGSRRNGTLYTGVTSEIELRGWSHKSKAVEGFTKRYGVHRVAYLEFHESMRAAITREKQIKKWRRAWKIQLIEQTNPQWQDLFEDLLK